ncbi:hypothetical protein E2542_SST24734 [Spatholobus suberectus]|nr:hypothetical protein E2542_SST24734 [Spatholobus suberectus]
MNLKQQNSQPDKSTKPTLFEAESYPQETLSMNNGKIKPANKKAPVQATPNRLNPTNKPSLRSRKPRQHRRANPVTVACAKLRHHVDHRRVISADLTVRKPLSPHRHAAKVALPIVFNASSFVVVASAAQKTILFSFVASLPSAVNETPKPICFDL